MAKRVLIIAIVFLLLPSFYSPVFASNHSNSSFIVNSKGTLISVYSAAGDDLLIPFDFNEGNAWIEFTCPVTCSEIDVSLLDSSGTNITPSIIGPTRIVINHTVSQGIGTLNIHNRGDSQTITPHLALPIGEFSGPDHTNNIPSPLNETNITLIEDRNEVYWQDSFDSNRGTVGRKDFTWINGSIEGVNDTDVLRFNSTDKDVFEFRLSLSSTDIRATAWVRSSELREIGVIFEAQSYTENLDHSERNFFVEILEGEELWVEITSESVFSQWSLQFARHLGTEESIQGEYQGSDGQLPAFAFSPEDDTDSLEFTASGWVGASDEDCIAIVIPVTEVAETHNLSTFFWGVELNVSIQAFIYSSWYSLTNWSEKFDFEYDGYNYLFIESSIPSQATWISYCIESNETTDWSLISKLSIILDTPSGFPLSLDDARNNWLQWAENDTLTSSLELQIFDLQDTYWFETEGWPESEYFVRFSCTNNGERPIYIEAIEVNWEDRSKNSSANITLQGGESADLTIRVGVGTHILSVSDLNSSIVAANWSWGDPSMKSNDSYQITLTILPTEVGKEPWFPPDQIALTASKWFIIVIGISFSLPFLYLVLRYRSKKNAALSLIGKQNRLSVLKDILAKGEVGVARESVEENLQLISILSWEEGIEAWGKPSLRHHTAEVDLAVWPLDQRIGENNGLPFIIGLHIKEDLWENAGMRIESPEGSPWVIDEVKPKLLFKDDEIFLDQLHKGSRTFVQIEISGSGSGIEIALSGVVNSQPVGLKTAKKISVSKWDEEE